MSFTLIRLLNKKPHKKHEIVQEIPEELDEDKISEQIESKEKILIIGSGIMGINSAYFLAKDGRYDVTVIEKDNPIKGATEQNGNALTFILYPAWTTMSIKQVMKDIVTFNSTPTCYFRLSLLFDKHFRFWAWKYLKCRDKECVEKSNSAMIKLGATSYNLFDDFIKDCTDNNPDVVEYHPEILTTIYKGLTKDAIEGKKELVKFFQNYVPDTQVVSPEKYDADFVYQIPIRCLNSARFVDYMKLRLSDKYGVTFIQGEVKAITCTETHVKAVEYADRMARVKKLKNFDKYIICAGTESINIGEMMGLKVPIMGFKGHSLNIFVKDRDIIDGTHIHMPETICVSRVGYNTTGMVRVTGFADVDGNNLNPIPWRKDMLTKLAKKFVSEEDYDESKANHWVGLRPVTADDVPLIGKSSKFSNLFWNTGHGSRGVIQSIASALVLHSVISDSDCPEGLAAKDYDPKRFDI
ncbi:unnamed protein product [Moneuplotes crassus]|uniref:FAD dependent oxidoreductase domain-containing protein n=1 Tax=Euplotes crassus TaxID=5936 RepID=A0AAD1UNL5_EUPCR|nr:unnamed protein product [Moneuplotes crassus]